MIREKIAVPCHVVVVGGGSHVLDVAGEYEMLVVGPKSRRVDCRYYFVKTAVKKKNKFIVQFKVENIKPHQFRPKVYLRIGHCCSYP